MYRRNVLTAALAATVVPMTGFAQPYDPGASATDIKLGQTAPYSGPASAYSVIPRTQVAYFKMVSDKGGINGRKVTLLSVDDGYSPPRAVEGVRRLVEQDEVLATFCVFGTPQVAATQPYLNQKKIPQIIFSGASRYSDPAKFPWTLSLYPSYALEGATFARYVLANKPNAKIAILSQNDDVGRDFIAGLKKGLGAKASSMVVAEATYEITDPTIAPQMQQLKASGADTVFNAGTPKATAQSLKIMGELSWKPLHLIASTSSSIKSVIEPGGVANAVGVVTGVFLKNSSDPQFANDPDVKTYEAFIKQYVPDADPADFNIAIAYMTSVVMSDIIRRAGNDLTRKNLMAMATSIPATQFPLLLPGLKLGTSPTNYEAFNMVRLQRFDGSKYVLIE